MYRESGALLWWVQNDAFLIKISELGRHVSVRCLMNAFTIPFVPVFQTNDFANFNQLINEGRMENRWRNFVGAFSTKIRPRIIESIFL